MLVNSFGIEPPRALPPCLKVDYEFMFLRLASRLVLSSFVELDLGAHALCMYACGVSSNKLVACQGADSISPTEVPAMPCFYASMRRNATRLGILKHSSPGR